MSRHGPDHEQWADAVGAYLLGALETGESERFEAHLAVCPRCRDDVADLRVAADALPVSVPLVAPPPALKGRIMAVVDSEAELLAATGPRADAHGARAPQKVRPQPRGAGAAGSSAAGRCVPASRSRARWRCSPAAASPACC